MKITHHLIVNLIATSLLASFLGACETPQDQAIESARACDNSAAQVSTTNPTLGASMATNCIAILQNANVTTAEAEKVMFGAILIEDQIINNIASAAAALKSNPNSSAGINTMLNLFLPTVPSGSSYSTEYQRITTTGTATGDSGSIYIASMIGMSISLEILAGNLNSQNPNSANAATALSDLQTCATTSSCYATVGPLFTSLEASACASPYDQTSTSPTDMCYQAKQVQNAANQAAGNSNPSSAQIVTALAAYANTTP